MRGISVGLLVLSFLSLPARALAQEEGRPEERVYLLDSLVVVANQVQRSSTVTLVSREDAERRRAPVAYDALSTRPGLYLTRRLGLTGAGLSRLAIRGAGVEGPAGLQVFIDGRPDPTVTFAHPAPQAHGMEGVEVVEVIHGPSPVLHGSGNTGVLNIRSSDPESGWSGRVVASGGSYGTGESYIASAYGWDGGYVSTSAVYRRTDGYLPNSDAWILGGKVRIGQRMSEKWRVRFTAGQTHDHFGVYGPFSVPGPFGNPGTTALDLTQTAVDMTVEGQIGGLATSLQVWGDDLEPRSQVLAPGAPRAAVMDMGTRFRALMYPWSGNRIILGLDVLRAMARNTPLLPPGSSEIDASISEVGPYLFAEQRVNPFATVSGGVRVTRHSEYGTEPSAEAGLLIHPHGGRPDSPLRNTTLRVRTTRGFQSPTLQQLFGVFRGGAGGPANPGLEPERVMQHEVGIHQAMGMIELDAVAFRQAGDNLIVPVQGELGNTGRFERSGVEARAGLYPDPGLRFDLGLTYYELEEGILRVPESTVDFGVDYAPAALRDRAVRVSMYGRHASGIYDRALAPNSPRVRLDDYLTMDLKLRFLAWRRMHAMLELVNLTDEHYETVLGIPMPGRSLFAGLSVDW